MLDATKVIIPLADQTKVTGALRRGPVITEVPTTFAEALEAIEGFTSSGYVSEEGATLTTELSTTDIREWNRSVVRRSPDSFDATVSCTLIQLDTESAYQAFGEDNVTVTPATAEHGEQIHIALGAQLPEAQAWALCMKDGDVRIIVLVCNGTVTSGLDMTFSASDPMQLPIEISGNDDGTGKSVHVFVDDGKRLLEGDGTEGSGDGE